MDYEANTLGDRLRELLSDHADVELAVLVGSRARGVTGGGDVDLLVHLVPKTDERFAALRDQLEPEFGVAVDIATLSTAARMARFRDRVIEDGLVIVDRAGRWPWICSAPNELARQLGDDDLTDGERKAIEFLETDEWFEQEIARLQGDAKESSG